MELQYRDHAVDIHSHIVPAVDDGSQSVSESMELLSLDREEGIDAVFATPHYGEENGYAPGRDLVHSRFRDLSGEKLRRPDSVPRGLYLGTEWYCSEDIVRRIKKEEAFPMGASDWYMVEFLEWGSLTESGETILRRLTGMKQAGIHTILAHPERYRALQQDWDLARRICDLGVLLQVNAYDLFLNQKAATQDLAQWMARERLISFLGSDMHGTRPGSRRPLMKEGIRWLYENTDRDYADRVVRVNAENYLAVEKLCTAFPI